MSHVPHFTLLNLIITTAAVLFIHISYLIISRLLIDPLSRIPGPTLAAISSWYECYYDIFSRPGGGAFPFKLKELHERHGPIIRINPTQVHINDPDFLDTIYALRDRNVPQTRALMVEGSMGAAEEFELHKLRRQAIEPFFALRGILSLEHRIRDKVSKLHDKFEHAAGTRSVFNLSDAFFGFSNDLVRSFCFGADDDLLSESGEAHTQRTNLTRLLMGTRFRQHFPWIPKMAGLLLQAFSIPPPPAVLDLLRFRDRIMNDIKGTLSAHKRDGQIELETGAKSVFHELRDSPILPEKEKTAERMRGEAMLIVMAGTESTQKSLSIATFYLLSNPTIVASLRKELAETLVDADGSNIISLQTLMSLPYLNGVIQEAHRLSFGVTGRILRYAPHETLQYTASYGPHKGTTYALPPRTVMSCVTLCTHTNETIFPSPWTFDPERWIVSTLPEGEKGIDRSHGNTEEDINRRKRVMMALGKGHKKCIGMHLAHAVMTLVLQEVVGWDMELHETEDEDVKFVYDQQVSQPRMGSQGVRVIVNGRSYERD